MKPATSGTDVVGSVQHKSSRGYSGGGRGRGRGYTTNIGRGGRGREHGSYAYFPQGDSSASARRDRIPQGDMKTGLFKDSFLEDPWAELMRVKRNTEESKGQPKADGVVWGEDSEGEIDLGEAFDGGQDGDKEGGHCTGLGDGIAEAAQGV